MIKKVAILANGGDVSGFNAVMRAIIKTAENNNIECYGFIDGYRGLLNNDFVRLSTSESSNASGILPKGGSIIGSSTNANVFNYKVVLPNGEIEYQDLSDKCVRVFSAGHVSYHKVTRVSRDDLGFTVYSIEGSNNERFAYNKNKGILQYWCTRNGIETVVVYRELK